MANLTQKDFHNLRKLVRRSQSKPCFLSIEELEDLEHKLTAAKYEQQLREFKQLMDDLMRKADESHEEQEKFYDLEWTIIFAGQTIKVGNGAAIYNGMHYFLDEELEIFE